MFALSSGIRNVQNNHIKWILKSQVEKATETFSIELIWIYIGQKKNNAHLKFVERTFLQAQTLVYFLNCCVFFFLMLIFSEADLF